MEADDINHLFNFLQESDLSDSQEEKKVPDSIPQVEKDLLDFIAAKQSDEELIQIFNNYTAHIGLKFILLKHLYKLCKALSSNGREKVAKRFGEFVAMDDLNSYRFRTEFADQLISTVDLFDGISVNRYFSGFALTYSADRIACIRNKGIELLATVIGVLLRDEWQRFVTEDEEENPSTTDLVCLALTDRIVHDARNSFWNSRNWRQRQSFGRLLHTLLDKKITTCDQFCYLFYEDLMRISEDPVPNVRQYFCVMAQLSADTNFFETCDSTIGAAIRRRLEKMSAEDTDREICYLAHIALGRDEAAQNMLSETVITTIHFTETDDINFSEGGGYNNITDGDNEKMNEEDT